MSANLYWRPVHMGRQALAVSTPSAFVAAMGRAFGGPAPWRLGIRELDKLRGMAALWDHDPILARRLHDRVMRRWGDVLDPNHRRRLQSVHF